MDYFSFPGYGFRNFLDGKHLIADLVTCAPDIVIILLGGNDIKIDVDLNIVKKDCEGFYLLLRSKLPKSFIIASQVEHRHLDVPNRHGTPSVDLYRKLANNFNKWLARQSFKDKILLLNGADKLSNPIFFRSDGIHLNQKGLSLVFDLILSCLEDPLSNILHK